MAQSGQATSLRAIAAVLPAMALGLLPLAAGAQEQPLPSVSDYRLPPPSPRATRAPGPVDPSNPVVPTRREERPAPPAAPATSAASPAPSASPAPAARPSPRPSAAASPSPTASPSRAAAPRRAEEAPTRESEERREAPAQEPEASREEASPAPAPSPAEPAAIASPPVQWNVHSAKDAEGNPLWPWLVGIAVLLASNVLLLVMLLRRRQRKADEAWAAQQTAPAEEIPAPEPVQPVSAPAASAAPAAQPDIEPDPDEPAPVATPVPAQARTVPPAPPVLELVAKPIEVTLAARQLSATLMNTVLNYELVVTNLSDDTVGPIIIAGDMIGAHASLPTRSQLEITANDLQPHHRHPLLHPREWAKFSGEFRLPLAAITPIRSGRASLFVPLARFRVEVLRNGAPPLVINRAFVIGETPETPEAALKPFRLDLGPRLYSQIGQREVAATA